MESTRIRVVILNNNIQRKHIIFGCLYICVSLQNMMSFLDNVKSNKIINMPNLYMNIFIK